ncbi:hypothetical protein GCM10010339_48370 [Streptomyces alanosinicus]|uniref:Isoprenylcysteine carboxylmethyltransferase family protein n=1 Tax=Streptomyces alanosinicus TaxID=68171 RepID=A0A918YJZ0_9ACTN|nr:hypothetical protein GCM10010339_48370 [Streptomyces alanosinicus]
MRKATAVLGSALFLVLAAGCGAVLLPWWLTGGWRTGHWPLPPRLLGLVPLAAGTAVILAAYARFALEGRGTPAPVAPPARLVVSGAYRYVRNPIYLAVVAVLAGQGLLLARPVLFGLCRRRLGAAPGLRPPVRGAGAAAPLRGRLRALPAGGAALVAPAHPLAGHLRGAAGPGTRRSPCPAARSPSALVRHESPAQGHGHRTKPVVFRRPPGRPPTGLPRERLCARKPAGGPTPPVGPGARSQVPRSRGRTPQLRT